ncbi:MAG: LutB/LldF family L-lactate oxidation iron-sulfur protein [Hyphomicrobiaceae bacterium]
MKPTSAAFKEQATRALDDSDLQTALGRMRTHYVGSITSARERLPEFEALRDAARDIKNHTLAHLDLYLEELERKVTEAGGYVHWATTAAEARTLIETICRRANARTVTKGKSMISEEIALNAHLEKAGFKVVETDLGEYLIQIRNEPPSHIIGPAVHLTRAQIEADFRRHHKHLPAGRNITEPVALVDEARQVLRQQFITADVGITGANFLIAETGTTVIVTNEGNGDLTQILPRIHIVLATIEKVVPTLEDVSTILRVLARSATGQEISNYTTFSTGPRRSGDPDGPTEYHLVLLDGGRTEILASEFREALRCIRCGACMDHCPVYHAVGGHAYGWVYPGPIGAVMTPALIGIQQARHLPSASSFCGRCEDVCPMRIPLPKMLRYWREHDHALARRSDLSQRALRLWAWLAQRPAAYHRASRVGLGLMRLVSGPRGLPHWLPFTKGWTRHRDFPAPEKGGTFHAQWAKRGRRTS